MSYMDWGDETPTNKEIINYYRTSAAITKCYLRWVKRDGRKIYKASESAGKLVGVGDVETPDKQQNKSTPPAPEKPLKMRDVFCAMDKPEKPVKKGK